MVLSYKYKAVELGIMTGSLKAPSCLNNSIAILFADSLFDSFFF